MKTVDEMIQEREGREEKIREAEERAREGEKDTRMERIAGLEEDARNRAKRLAEENQGKIDRCKNGILELQAKKRGIFKGRISKAEAVSRMKADWKRGLEERIMPIVKGQLVAYQGQLSTYERFDHTKLHLVHNLEMINFIFCWISGEMIDEAAKSLEEGLSEKERNQKILDADKEIDRLAKELEGLLK